MASKPTPEKPRSSREDVLQFLDSLDSYSSPPPPARTTPASASTPKQDAPAATGAAATPTHAAPIPSVPTVTNAEEAQSVLDFLDEITQRSSTPTAPVKPDSLLGKKPAVGVLSRSASRSNMATPVPSSPSQRKSGESTRSRTGVPGPDSPSPATASTSAAASAPATTAAAEEQAGAGWGWSSMWNQASSVVAQASNVVQQARTVAEEQVKTNAAGLTGVAGNLGGGLMKALGENEQAKKWSEGVVNYAKGVQLDQLGNDLKSQTLRSLTDLLNAVAPPIAEHEVIQVSLSHDMIGYDGVETLVYNGLAKIMEQIEGGTLIVNKGSEDQPRDTSDDPDDRNLNAVEGFDAGWKLAAANVDELIKTTYKPSEPTESASSLTVPVTTCPLYIRIQPILAPLPSLPNVEGTTQLFFLFLLQDPTHKITHHTISQSIPGVWLDVPFEQNEWVEDFMVDVLRKGTEILGKEYIDTRMHAQSIAISKAREAAQQALANAPPPTEEELKQQAEEKAAVDESAAVAAAAARVV